MIAAGSIARPLVVVVALATLSASCRSADDRRADAFRARLRQETTLTAEERAQLVAQVGRALNGRTLRIRQNAAGQAMNEEQRAAVLGILGAPSAGDDAGLRTEGGTTLRGIRSRATPPGSEVDAAQTLWIDVDRFLPWRYDFAFSMPGFGDYSYDLVVE